MRRRRNWLGSVRWRFLLGTFELVFECWACQREGGRCTLALAARPEPPSITASISYGALGGSFS